MLNDTEERLERLGDSLSTIVDEFDHQVDELYFLSIAIPAIFSDGSMPTEKFIDGMHFSTMNLADRMDKIRYEFRSIANTASVENNTQEIITEKNPPEYIQEYIKFKSNFEDSILLYQMGDFYEMFWEDAEKASKILGLSLTTRKRTNGFDITPMCGFPCSRASKHIATLVKAGKRITVCDLIEENNGVTRHQIIRTVSPGKET